MTINDVNRGTGRLDPRTMGQGTAPLAPPPAPETAPAAPTETPNAPAVPAPDGAGLTGSTDRLAVAGQMNYDPVPWRNAIGAAKDSFDDLKEAVSGMSYRQVMSSAANGLGLAKGVGDLTDGISDLRDGDLVGGTTGIIRGATDAASSGLKLSDSVMGTRNFSGVAADLKSVGSLARGVSGTLDGVDELRNGEYLSGSAHLTAGVMSMTSGAASIAAGRTLAAAAQTGRQMGLTGDALDAFKRQELRGTFGAVSAPLAVGATAINGAFDVAEGIQAMRDGNVLDGALQAGQGALDTAASASHIASILPTASRAVATFGRAAGPLGAAAGVVGGGMQAYEALSGDPPDYRSAAVGGAKAAGSALLLTPPPGNIAGGTILIGAALYENVTPVREVVDGAVGGVVEAAEGVGEGVAEVAEGVTEAAQEVAEGYQDVRRELAEGDVVGAAGEAAESVVEAASDLGRGVAEGASRVAQGIDEGLDRVGEGLSNAGESISSGFKSAGDSVGRFMSSLF